MRRHKFRVTAAVAIIVSNKTVYSKKFHSSSCEQEAKFASHKIEVLEIWQGNTRIT